MAITNISKVSQGETWGSISSTWASETRTWGEASQLLDNISKVSSAITNLSMSSTDPLWSYRTFPWQELLPWQITNSGLTNISKPV